MLLINHGAPIDCKDQDGRTPLFYAAEDREEPIVDLLFQQSSQVDTRCHELRTPHSYAASSCRTSHTKSLINNGAAINSSDRRCNTPLIYAAQVDIHRAQLDFEAKNPRDLFHHLKTESIRHSIEVLLVRGANPSTVNEDRYSPLLILEHLRPQHCRHLTEEHSKGGKERYQASLETLWSWRSSVTHVI